MSESKAMRLVFGETLLELAGEFPDLVVLDADCSSSTQTKHFGAKFPERFFNFGIAEGNMVSAAAGMAAAGLTPVVSTFAFLLSFRAGDPIRSLVAYSKLNVKIAAGYGGLSDFADGASHQSIADLGVVTSLPNMTVVCPSDTTTTAQAVRAMIEHDGPVYLRLSRAEVDQAYPSDQPFQIGRGIVAAEGSDVTIVAFGVAMSMARGAVEDLAAEGISARLIDMHTIKPLDVDLLQKAATETGAIVTAEEHNIYGGLGSAVASAVSSRSPVPVVPCGIEDRFGESGNYDEILARAGLSREKIVTSARRAIELKKS